MESTTAELTRVAELFRVLGNESRLRILLLLQDEEQTVTSITDASGMSQPLVSQHLKTMRQAGLLNARRDGREMYYALADHHVAHVVGDALTHVSEAVETP